MAEKKSGREIAEILNSCFWSSEILNTGGYYMPRDKGSCERKQLRQEIVNHLSSDAILAITIALAQKSLDKIREAHTRITKLREAAQNTLTAIDKVREDTDHIVG